MKRGMKIGGKCKKKKKERGKTKKGPRKRDNWK
jgi:hypothetical protein